MSLETKVKDLGKKYVITGAQRGARVNSDFLASLETYARVNNAELIILPIKGRTVDDTQLDESLVDYKTIDKNYQLNSKIRVSNYEILPQMIDPITGLGRFTQSDVSTIFAAPKLRMKVIPNSNIRLPKVLMTTGAVTMPNYRNNRIGRIAEQDHTYGAIVVELQGKTNYHYRQINALKNGIFYDLGMKYQGDNNPLVRQPEAMVLGDWHYGDTNKKVRAETFRMIEQYKPKRIFIHDFFNGYSINHHEKNQVATQARNSNMLSLEDELYKGFKELEKICQIAGNSEVVIVKSNHDEWLEQYIQKGDWLKEPQNSLIASKLFQYTVIQKDPLEVGYSMFGYLPENLKFLGIDDDYKVRGWQLGSHGHIGAHGARGSVRSIEYSQGKSISGHTHTPQIFRNVWQVGTSTNLKLNYNRGYSGWMNTHAMLYDNGKSQLINIVNGKHRGR